MSMFIRDKKLCADVGEIFEGVERGPVNKWLDFDGVPVHNLNPGFTDPAHDLGPWIFKGVLDILEKCGVAQGTIDWILVVIPVDSQEYSVKTSAEVWNLWVLPVINNIINILIIIIQNGPKIPSVLWRCWLGDRKGIRPITSIATTVFFVHRDSILYPNQKLSHRHRRVLLEVWEQDSPHSHRVTDQHAVPSDRFSK